jgi:hypothetical protein
VIYSIAMSGEEGDYRPLAGPVWGGMGTFIVIGEGDIAANGVRPAADRSRRTTAGRVYSSQIASLMEEAQV